MFCPQYLCYCDIITVKLASSSRDVNKAGSFKAKAKSLKAKAKCLKAKARSLKAKAKTKAKDQG